MNRYSSSLNQLVEDIVRLPNVGGIILYTIDEKIVNKGFTGSEPEEKHLLQFIRTICSLSKANVQQSVQFKTLECPFKDLVTLTCVLKKRHLLSIFYQKEANKRLVRVMALNSTNDINKLLAQTASVVMPRVIGAAVAGSVVGDETDQQGIVIKRSLLPRLDIIRDALQVALEDVDGTSTQVTMDESIQKWASLGPVSKKELPVLAEILSQAIGNEQKVEQFYKDIEDTFLGIKRR